MNLHIYAYDVYVFQRCHSLSIGIPKESLNHHQWCLHLHGDISPLQQY